MHSIRHFRGYQENGEFDEYGIDGKFDIISPKTEIRVNDLSSRERTSVSDTSLFESRAKIKAHELIQVRGTSEVACEASVPVEFSAQ